MLKRLFLTLALVIGCASVGAAGGVQLTSITGITTNTTSSPVRLAANSYKTVYGEVVCTVGACTQTQAIYGDVDDDHANGVLVCTITLSATPRDQAACSVLTASFQYYYVVTTNTTGTNATGAVHFMY